MPQWFSVWYWQKALQGTIGNLAIESHANAAKEEMQFVGRKSIKDSPWIYPKYPYFRQAAFNFY